MKQVWATGGSPLRFGFEESFFVSGRAFTFVGDDARRGRGETGGARPAAGFLAGIETLLFGFFHDNDSPDEFSHGESGVVNYWSYHTQQPKLPRAESNHGRQKSVLRTSEMGTYSFLFF